MIRTLSKTLAMASLGFLVSASLVLAAESGYKHAPDPDVYPTVITGRVMDVDRDGTVMIQTQDGQVYHVAPSQMRRYRLQWGEKAECVITHGELQCERE